MKHLSILGGSAAILLTLASHGAAATFTISDASTAAQTLGSGSGQTGTITSTGSLTVSGSTVAVTLTGNNETLTNNGTLSQTGNGRAIRDNVGVTNFVLTNNAGALIQTADADVIQMNKTPASVTINNYGTMTSLNASAGGSQAVDFNAIQSGSNIINNYSTGIMQAAEADAVRPGLNGVVNNDGLIKATTTTGSSSDGVDAQNNSGVSVTNSATGTIEGGRHGITGGAVDATVNFTMSVTNNLGGVIKGDDGSGINIDGFNNKEVVTVQNDGTITGDGVTGDGDGVDVDGLVNLTNTGTIKSLNSIGDTDPGQSEGITVGGGTIINSGTIEGDIVAGNTNALGRGITVAGVDKDINDNPIPVQAIYGPTSITNSGLIKGQTDSGIEIGGPASGFTVTITNQAGGSIEGGGAVAAIQTGADNDTVINSGSIIAHGTGKAIDLGDGNDSLQVTGGTASITGDVSGGTGTNTLTIDPTTGHSFSYTGSISNFSTVQIKSGTVTLSGTSTYTGTTQISGGKLVLNGANLLASGSSLDLDGGTLQLENVGAANGQAFASFSLTASSTLDLNSTTSITFSGFGTYTNGASLSVIGWDPSLSPTYAFRFTGDLTHSSLFLAFENALTINGVAPSVSYDGTYTDISVAAVPEPSTVYLALALAGFVVLRSRRKLAALLGAASGS